MATKQTLQEMNTKLTEQLCTANQEIAFLRTKLNDADIRARKLISARKHGTFQRSARLEEARRIAMATGQVVKA